MGGIYIFFKRFNSRVANHLILSYLSHYLYKSTLTYLVVFSRSRNTLTWTQRLLTSVKINPSRQQSPFEGLLRKAGRRH